MDGQLSHSSSVRRRHPGFRATLPGACECPRTASESVVLSGFPTAVEPFSSRRLSPGTGHRALSPDRKTDQLPLPRDDIPPQRLLLSVRSCCLRLARM
jgi:hypothetical protein